MRSKSGAISEGHSWGDDMKLYRTKEEAFESLRGTPEGRNYEVYGLAKTRSGGMTVFHNTQPVFRMQEMGCQPLGFFVWDKRAGDVTKTPFRIDGPRPLQIMQPPQPKKSPGIFERFLKKKIKFV